MSETLQIETPDQLATMIDGRSDTEIVEGLKTLGVDSALDKVFQGMVDAFRADRASGADAVIQWDVETPEGPRTYQLAVQNGKCTWNRGTSQNGKVTLAATAPNFLRLITGRLNGMQAYFQGKLKVSGDVMLAQKQEGWFQKPGQA